LTKKDPRCLECIVAHELTRMLERGHDEKFAALMDWFRSTGELVAMN
jgi:predicted metal-dependent hydrolase